MRALLAILLCLWAGLADAQSGRRIVLLSGGVPSWVLRAGGVPANVDLNFATGQAYGCSLASCLSITRASSKTNLLPSSASGFAYTTFGNNALAIDGNGLLIEEARTNQLLNSTAPATQTTGALAATAQTLWVNGSGSAALTNGTATGCAGTATNGTPVTFTPTAGTCTVTVTGSLNAFQLEAGAFGTSLIVTAGATATRAADVVLVTGSLLALLSASTGTVFATTTGVNQPAANGPRIIGNNGGVNFSAYLNIVSSAGVKVGTTNTSNSALNTANAVVLSGLVKMGASWVSGAKRSVVSNSGTVATDNSATIIAQVPQIGGGNSSSAEFIDGYISRLSVFNANVSDANLKAGTQ